MRTGVLVLSLLLAPLAWADMASLQRMADQLDAADEADFRAALLDAQICIGQRDFACADSKIKTSTRYLHTAKDRELLARVRDGLARERQKVDQERLAAEESARHRQAELEAEANRGPSVASQLLTFSNVLAQVSQQQQTLRLAEQAAAQRNWQQLQNAGRQQEARNQQLLANAAAARGGAASSAASASASTGARQPRNSLEVMAGYGEEGSMFDARAGHSQSSAEASLATLNAAVASSGGDTAVQQARAAAACGTEYDGPTDDVQIDTLCQLAAFDACVHRTTGITDYDAEGRKSCQNLKTILEATRNTSYSCRYCPYPYRD